MLDYADYCQAAALFLVEESRLAVLDACVLADERERVFGGPVAL